MRRILFILSSLCVIARNEAIQRTSIPWIASSFLLAMTQSVSLKLHKLGNCRTAIGKTEVDEVNATFKLTHTKLGLTSLAL